MAKASKADTDGADSGKKKGWKSAADRSRDGASSYVPAYEEIVEAPQRVVMASAALQKRGKTTWAFTAPKPLAYMQLDANYEHALKKARQQYGEDSIRHLKYYAEPSGDLRANNAAQFDRLIKDFDYAVGNYRSVVIDTSSELMDVRKLAEWGRTTQIPQIYYGPIYADFRWMVKRALDSNANVIFIHRLKDEWLAGDRTGGYVLEGWKGIQFDSQVYVEHGRDEDGKFTTNIIECAQDAMLMGMTLDSSEDENDFGTLASRIFTETSKEDWQ
jgi:hypothetical protein